MADNKQRGQQTGDMLNRRQFGHKTAHKHTRKIRKNIDTMPTLPLKYWHNSEIHAIPKLTSKSANSAKVYVDPNKTQLPTVLQFTRLNGTDT